MKTVHLREVLLSEKVKNVTPVLLNYGAFYSIVWSNEGEVCTYARA